LLVWTVLNSRRTLQRHLTSKYDLVRMIVGKIIRWHAGQSRIIVARRGLGSTRRVGMLLLYMQFSSSSSSSIIVSVYVSRCN